jgi:hypothetical protein
VRGGEEGPGRAVQEARSWNGSQSVIRGLAARQVRQSIKQLIPYVAAQGKYSNKWLHVSQIQQMDPPVSVVCITCINVQ